MSKVITSPVMTFIVVFSSLTLVLKYAPGWIFVYLSIGSLVVGIGAILVTSFLLHDTLKHGGYQRFVDKHYQEKVERRRT